MTLPKFAYFEGKIVPYDQAKVGVLNHTFNYGTGAFAGVRAYWNADREQLYIFRAEDHFRRFLNSARLLASELDLTPQELRDVAIMLLRAEDYHEDCYIRPLYYKADEIIGVRLHDLQDAVSMVSIPFMRYVDRDDRAHVTLSSWRRVDDNAIPARGKITGAYVNSALIKTDALRAGFDEALVMTDDGHISEGSAENVFMLRDGILVTPPITDNILEGITRRTVMTLAEKELGLKVVERSIDRTEIYLSQEVILTGTAAQVTAVTHVDHRPIGSGVIGPVASALRRWYDDVVRGRIPRYSAWNTAVYEVESIAAD